MQETYARTFRNFSLQFSYGMLLVNFHNISFSHTPVNILSDWWQVVGIPSSHTAGQLPLFRAETAPNQNTVTSCLAFFLFSLLCICLFAQRVTSHSRFRGDKFLNIYLKFPPPKDTWAQKTGFSWTHIETSPSLPSPVSKLIKTKLVKADQPLVQVQLCEPTWIMLFAVLIGTTIVSSSFQKQRFPSRPAYLL